MALTLLLAGTVAPFLLMFSPVSLATARDCLDWEAPAKAVDLGVEKPCPKKKPPLLLM
ncbi:hypothetical protein Sj15T_29310 [Sphingobium sp. TA15]|uniref:Uncharacterized protein n=1 Tax=Sphingobium indicum (strain DSM 16413 / CCM 7287 / MTCC 6362 / UT26 / NBRC 101211 / UT26S) TaxID=452662 RepID=D4YXE7_SPHIU|nr:MULTISPECIES: hypothetical protein [Sphingobium]EPR16290.1 hypothetical protein M527_21220 [Sphingobium indicum IP26]BDD67910.1 hypothetical protein Sj15T_29310 [Sphingobium sp. TA15]EQB01257.1 hypothetical protein L286_15815 [Sphingobium sp. HDIP04]NYI24125.1 hypothetical protein [Sphingobium indicum]BAI95029.1 hypothetical protein SJA_C1-01950 [Sphingobium indicum UT26S]